MMTRKLKVQREPSRRRAALWQIEGSASRWVETLRSTIAEKAGRAVAPWRFKR